MSIRLVGGKPLATVRHGSGPHTLDGVLWNQWRHKGWCFTQQRPLTRGTPGPRLSVSND